MKKKLLLCAALSLLALLGPARAGVPLHNLPIVVTNTAALQGLPTSAAGASVVFRASDGSMYNPSGSACPIGGGDGISQIPSADGKCWLNVLNGLDVTPSFFGPVGLGVAVHGAKNSLIGTTYNTSAPNTVTFPAGVTGYGTLEVGSQGSATFGLFGLGDLKASSGDAVGGEVTVRNLSGQLGDITLPPNNIFGTLQSVPNGWQVTCGTTPYLAITPKDCSVGVYVSNDSGVYSDAEFSTDLYITLFRHTGIVVDSQPLASGAHTGMIIKDNSLGVNLELLGAGSNNNTMLDVVDFNGLHRMHIDQSGNIFTTSKIEMSQPVRPTATVCGTSPSVNSSTDQAGLITVGTGTVTSCLVSFNVPFTHVPACTVTGEGTGSTVLSISLKNTLGFTVASSANMATQSFDYHCFDQN